MSTTLADIEARLDAIHADVEQLRAQPTEVEMLDAVIRWATDRRTSLTCWQPSEVGDWSLLREIARRREVEDSWSWGQASVEAWDHGTITADEMVATFGVDWIHVVQLVRTGAALTPEQVAGYREAVMRVYNEDRTAWNAAYRAVIVYGGPGGAARRALLAFVVAGFAVVGSALARRSEVQAGDIAQEHYDRLTRAWREEIGPIHPGDEVA